MARNVSPTELSNSPPPSSKSTNHDDWTCEDCGNINFARRSTCNRCSKTRINTAKKRKLGTEIGKVAAEKSGGLFNAEDWQCYKCANVNWARRQQCNVCNTPKFAILEERTGFGGGYNDRGVVEYKEREDSSDDEYDEFGRKRKRRSDDKLRSRRLSDEKSREKKEDKDDEEEEEEDDDEEEDLSKYDLSDFGGPDDSLDKKEKS